MSHRIAVINPGSTSTKMGLFDGGECVAHKSVDHQFAGGTGLWEQLPLRREVVRRFLAERCGEEEGLDAVVGRGGLLPPLPAGTYDVTPEMLETLRGGQRGVHASNLGAFLASEIAEEWEARPFIVDPVSVDEMDDVARISGLKGVERVSMCHALNIRAVAHRFADDEGRRFDALRLVVAHLGSGVSMAAICDGRMVDVINPRDEGPMGLDRPGAVPNFGLVDLCFDGATGREDIERLLLGDGGVYSYLETRDLRDVVTRRGDGDEGAKLLFDALVYDAAKWIGALATTMRGELDALILTGGMAHSEDFVAGLRERVDWIAPVSVYPGEDELEALASGALRVLRGRAPVCDYSSETP